MTQPAPGKFRIPHFLVPFRGNVIDLADLAPPLSKSVLYSLRKCLEIWSAPCFDAIPLQLWAATPFDTCRILMLILLEMSSSARAPDQLTFLGLLAH